MGRLHVQPGVRRAMLWGHHLDPVQRTGPIDRLLDFAGNRAWFDSLRLSREILLEYDSRLRTYRPRCLVAYASALAALAETVEEAGRAPASYPSRAIVTGAEKLLADQRAVAERVFRVPIHERYGSRDVGDMGFQYEPWSSLEYRVDWALVLVEPASSDKESDVIVTKFHGDAMPMIRYRTDDVGIFDGSARTGYPSMVLREVIGRRADRVFKRDGGWVNGLHFPHLLKEFGLADFRVHQHADYSVHVSVIFRPGGAGERALDQIKANLASNLSGLPVEVNVVDAIPRTKANKWRPVVSDVVRGGK